MSKHTFMLYCIIHGLPAAQEQAKSLHISPAQIDLWTIAFNTSRRKQ